MFKQDKTLTKLIAKKIRTLRLNAGYVSMRRFALDNDINEAVYHRIESHKRGATIGTINNIAKAHNISLSEFFADINN